MPAGDTELPDDVPVADAVERLYSTPDSPTDEERPDDVPLETTASDWQAQRETVVLDPEFEEFGQRG